MKHRYDLYGDGKITGASSDNIEWLEKHIRMLIDAKGLAKQFGIYEVIDNQTGDIVYFKTREELTKNDFKEQSNEEFTDEQLKAIKSLERAFKKCANVDLWFYSEGDSLMAFKKGTDVETLNVDIDTSRTLRF